MIIGHFFFFYFKIVRIIFKGLWEKKLKICCGKYHSRIYISGLYIYLTVIHNERMALYVLCVCVCVSDNDKSITHEWWALFDDYDLLKNYKNTYTHSLINISVFCVCKFRYYIPLDSGNLFVLQRSLFLFTCIFFFIRVSTNCRLEKCFRPMSSKRSSIFSVHFSNIRKTSF